MPIPIWLDCDPGHDDVIAIFLAAQRSELVGISVVSGNAPLAFTERNGLIACEVAGVAAPLHVGAAKPLVRRAEHAEYIHGETGLDGPVIPSVTREAAKLPAVRALLDAAEKRDDLWLVAIGPLTNVALALMLEPALATRLKGISIMGGAYGPGNVTAAAEFNIWADPEAAHAVFSYGGRLVMAGLDLTYQFQAVPDRVAAVAEVGGRLATVLADLLRFFSHTYVSRHEGVAGAAVHDPCAVLAVTHRHLFTTRMAHVDVETAGNLARGMTVIDDRLLVERPAPTCEVLATIDADAAWAVVVEAIRSFSG